MPGHTFEIRQVNSAPIYLSFVTKPIFEATGPTGSAPGKDGERTVQCKPANAVCVRSFATSAAGRVTEEMIKALTPVSLYASQLAKRKKLASVAQVTASSSEPENPPEHTVENDLSTRWAAQAIGSWITYDLGAERTVSGVGVAFYRGTERIAYIQIATSLDGTTWNPPISLQSSGTTNDSQIFDLTDVRARYVRIISLGNSQNTFAAITKTDIYGI